LTFADARADVGMGQIQADMVLAAHLADVEPSRPDLDPVAASENSG
jgi:hypothetical protein